MAKLRIFRIVQHYKQVGFHLIAVLQFCSPLLASEVVFFKMPSRQQKRRAKRREEYLQNRDGRRVTVLPRFGTKLTLQKRASSRDSRRGGGGGGVDTA